MKINLNLTQKQSSFVENLSTGFNASDAYRAAYNASEMSDKTIWEASSRLSKNPKVVARLDQLSAEIEQVNRMFTLSYEDRIINKLWHIAEHSKSGRVRVKALELIGRSCGLF